MLFNSFKRIKPGSRAKPAVDPVKLPLRAAELGLDLGFYRGWHTDLAKFDDAKLLDHWLRFGQAEGRPSSFESLLRSRQLEGSKLPLDFDWRTYVSLYADLAQRTDWNEWKAALHYLEVGTKENRKHTFEALPKALKLDLEALHEDFDAPTYLLLNPQLKDEGIVSEPLAKLHYLKTGRHDGLPYAFDERFYAGYYEEPGLTQRAAALQHWLEKGRHQQRSPNFDHLLHTKGFDAKALLSPTVTGSIMELNPDMQAANCWALLLALLTQDSPRMARVSANALDNRDFYMRLALHYEAQGNDPKAEPIYRMALHWGASAQACEHLGNIALRANRLHHAVAWYERALSMGSESLFVHLNLVRALRDLGLHERSLERAERAVRELPDSSHIEAMAWQTADRYWDAAGQELDVMSATEDRPGLVERVGALARQQYALCQTTLRRGTGTAPRHAPINRERVLIVGDFHVPQCVRYRIDQKLEQLEAAGYEAKAVSWTTPDEALRELAWHDQIIFYRVPALPAVVRLIATARALGKMTFYEIDDLLFDPIYPPPLETYGGYVGIAEYAGLMRSMALTRAAASLCDYGLASTLPLLRELAPLVRSGRCFLHRNGLDRQNIIPAQLPEPAHKGYLNLFYGSGTKAHNSDFVDEALPAIERLLDEHEQLKLTVVGYLQLPEQTLRRFQGRIVQVPLIKNVQAYWNYVAASDINLAVLTRDRMTDSKSELKWFEAACFGVPSVVSATQNYLDVVRDGEDGCLASTPEHWYAALSRLVGDAALRRRIGQAARERVLQEYSVPALARQARQWLSEAADLHDARGAPLPLQEPVPAALPAEIEEATPRQEQALAEQDAV